LTVDSSQFTVGRLGADNSQSDSEALSCQLSAVSLLSAWS
jgi:hypothetical protein